MSSFLTPDEIITLTGIKRGHDGKTREELQVEQLRIMGVPFRVNARGAPVVTWAGVDGVTQTQPAQKHIPAALRAVR